MSATSGYRPEIDGLRTIAVLSVLFFHVGFSAFSGGFVGVDVFFVISGYLITRKIVSEVGATGRLNFGHFYAGRVRRLIPALAVTLAASFVAAYVIFPPEPMQAFAASLPAAAFSFSNVHFWLSSGYFDAASGTKPLLHTWSLSVEEQFYLLWPAMLALTLIRRPRWLAPAMVAFVGVVSLASSVAFLTDRSMIYYLLPFRAFELAIGAGLVWGERWALREGRALELLTMAGLVMISIPVFGFTSETVFPSYNALIPCLGAALVIYSGRSRGASRLLANGPMVLIGLISYSLYLVHWPIFVFYSYAADDFTMLDRISVCLASIAAAATLYRFVEAPFRKPGSWPIIRGWRAPAFAAVLLGILSVPAARASIEEGWPWRFSDEVKALTDKSKFDIGLAKFRSVCFMVETQGPGDMPRDCYEIDPKSSKKNVLLIGDSTAYSFVPGLNKLLEGRANLFVWSAAICPALPGFDVIGNRDCKDLMNYFYEKVLPANKYDLVLISNYRRWDVLTQKLPDALKLFDRYGVPAVLIGQAIEYNDSPVSLFAKHGALSGLDRYMRRNLVIPCEGEHGLDKFVPPDRFFSMKAVQCHNGMPNYLNDGVAENIDTLHLNERGSLRVSEELVHWLEQRKLL